MGKRGTRKKAVGTSTTTPGSVTLRQESSYKKKQSHVNPKSMLKLDHLKNLAIWASAESCIPSLGAFFGHKLAVSAESLGVPPDPTLFTCQRCESILQAGYNCTVRIEKNKKKGCNRRNKPSVPLKNCVVYECHFCSHRNLKRGTPRGYMKDLYPAKITTSRVGPTKSATRKSEQLDTLVGGIDKARADPTKSAIQKSKLFDTSVASHDKARLDPTISALAPEQLDTLVATIDKARVDTTESAILKSEQLEPSVVSSDSDINGDGIVLSEIVGDEPTAASPAIPASTVTVTLLDSNKKKRNRTGSKKKVEPQDGSSMTDAEKTIPTSSKRRRKSWTSLKEIAESEGGPRALGSRSQKAEALCGNY